VVAARIELTTAGSAVESTTAASKKHRARRRAKMVQILNLILRNTLTNDKILCFILPNYDLSFAPK